MGNPDWLTELPSVINLYNNTIHSSTKMTPVQASKKRNAKFVFDNYQDKRKKLKPRFKLGDSVRSCDNKRVFSKGDATNWSCEFYTITELIHDTIPSYRIDYLPERYNQNFLRLTNLTLDEDNQDMKKQNLIQ